MKKPATPKRTVAEGLVSSVGTGIGVFIYHAAFVHDWRRGIEVGVFAAFLVLVIYCIIAVCRREGGADEGSQGTE